jgi:deazaflavin-dependent oxidoreductase (nitroreductase family)
VRRKIAMPRAQLTKADVDEDFCYLETTGRVTGQSRRVELWFGARPDTGTVYFLAGGGERTHWVRNIAADPNVRLRIRGRTRAGHGRLIAGTDEEENGRRLLAAKYQGWQQGRQLSRWARESTPVAVDLSE